MERAKESVWDYPRPPRLEPCTDWVRVFHQGVRLADTRRALRVLEESHPPTYYIPPADIDLDRLRCIPERTYCEWKGMAQYWAFKDAEERVVGWSYVKPTESFESIAGYLSFYPGRTDECYVADEKVSAQDSGFYGGWITSWIVGPFKGPAGTQNW